MGIEIVEPVAGMVPARKLSTVRSLVEDAIERIPGQWDTEAISVEIVIVNRLLDEVPELAPMLKSMPRAARSAFEFACTLLEEEEECAAVISSGPKPDRIFVSMSKLTVDKRIDFKIEILGEIARLLYIHSPRIRSAIQWAVVNTSFEKAIRGRASVFRELFPQFVLTPRVMKCGYVTGYNVIKNASDALKSLKSSTKSTAA